MSGNFNKQLLGANDSIVGSANPFGGPKPVKYDNTPAPVQRSVPTCPACVKPFVENGKFSICRHCPYRIAPKTIRTSHLHSLLYPHAGDGQQSSHFDQPQRAERTSR